MDETPETVEVHDPELLRLIERDAPVERLCTGFRFSEGPIWPFQRGRATVDGELRFPVEDHEHLLAVVVEVLADALKP